MLGSLMNIWRVPELRRRLGFTFLIIALAVVAAVVFMQEGQRRIPIQYAKRVIGRRMSGGGQTYLPLRVNMAGVIPVIFAASIMAFPPTVGQLLQSDWATNFSNFFFGGTSLLIVVGVALDTMKQLEAQLMMRNYEGFLK